MDQVLPLPLVLRVPCHPSPGARSVPHEVVIGTEWSVATGHDPHLERIAAGFGGGVSCLSMLARTLPAFQQWRERARRSGGLPIRSDNSGATWSPLMRVAGCCPPTGFRDAASAGAHSRSPRHVAAETGVPAGELGALVRGLGPRADPALPLDGGLGPFGCDDLAAAAWDCGLTPAWVTAVRTAMAEAEVSDVELEVLLAIASCGADPGWVASTGRALSVRPESTPLRNSPLAWIAWTATELDRQRPTIRAEWIARGVRPADLVTLSGAGYGPTDAHDLAGLWGVSIPGAAQILARWVDLGYRPTPTGMAALRDSGMSYPPWPPAAEAVTRVLQALEPRRATTRRSSNDRRARRRRAAGTDGERGPWRGTLDRTDVALALLRWGTVADTVAALNQLAEDGGALTGPVAAAES